MVHRLLPIAQYTHRIATVGVNFFPLPGLAVLLVPLLGRIFYHCHFTLPITQCALSNPYNGGSEFLFPPRFGCAARPAAQQDRKLL